MFQTLTEDNLILYAAKNYYNPKCIDIDEFYEDLNKFKYIKRLCNKYERKGELSERLILNHLIVLFNAFGVEPTLRMMELKMKGSHWNILKPFLIYLNFIRNDQYTNIKMDKKVIEQLRKI
jgi:hypothetical protein